MQIPVAAGLHQFEEAADGLHRPLHLLKGSGRGQGAELHLHVLRGLAVQRDVQRQPGRQGGTQPLQTRGVGLHPGQLPVRLQHLSHRLLTPGLSLGGKESGLRHLRSGGEQASALHSEALQHGQRTLGVLLIHLRLEQSVALRPGQLTRLLHFLHLTQQSTGGLPHSLRVRLVHLDAAHFLKGLEKRFPILAHGQQRQTLHFDNCHQIFTTFSIRKAAA